MQGVKRWIACVGIILLLLSSCKPVKYFPIESVRDVYHTAMRSDTVVQRDSIVITHAGDTVRELRWRDRWHIRWLSDTVVASDTIREPYPVEVPAKLTTWERIKVDWGGWAMFALLIFLAIKTLLFYLRKSK